MVKILEYIIKNSQSAIIITIITTTLSIALSIMKELSLGKNERRIEIMKKSLTDFYMPIHRKYGDLKVKQLSKSAAYHLYVYIFIRAEKNYLYVNPLVHKYLKSLKKNLDTNGSYRYIIEDLIKHVNNETYKTRKILGYPYLRLFDAFKVLDFHDFMLFSTYIFFVITLLLAHSINIFKETLHDEIIKFLSILFLLFGGAFILSLAILFICIFKQIIFTTYKFFKCNPFRIRRFINKGPKK